MCDLDYRNLDIAAAMQDRINERLMQREQKPAEVEYDPMAKISSLRVWAYDIHGNRFQLSTLQPLSIEAGFDNDFNSVQEFDFSGPHIENLIRENQE